MGAAVKQTNARTGSPFERGRTYRPKSPIDKAKAYEVIWNQVSDLFDAARPCEDVNFVYLIGEADGGAFKIGVSKDPIGRLRTMQTGNPRRLRIEYVLVGDMATEKLLHELWEPFAVISSRSSGKAHAAPGTEWFKPDAREQFLPIVEDAVARQVAYLRSDVRQETEGYCFRELERFVRDAHAESGFVARQYSHGRFLAQGPGYVEPRRSRI